MGSANERQCNAASHCLSSMISGARKKVLIHYQPTVRTRHVYSNIFSRTIRSPVYAEYVLDNQPVKRLHDASVEPCLMFWFAWVTLAKTRQCGSWGPCAAKQKGPRIEGSERAPVTNETSRWRVLCAGCSWSSWQQRLSPPLGRRVSNVIWMA